MSCWLHLSLYIASSSFPAYLLIMSKHISGTAEAAATFLLDLGKKKGKGKSVTFILPDDYEGVAATDTNHNDIGSDENLNTLPQQAPQKVSPC